MFTVFGLLQPLESFCSKYHSCGLVLNWPDSPMRR
jgi:hypothetical protein